LLAHRPPELEFHTLREQCGDDSNQSVMVDVVESNRSAAAGEKREAETKVAEVDFEEEEGATPCKPPKQAVLGRPESVYIPTTSVTSKTRVSSFYSPRSDPWKGPVSDLVPRSISIYPGTVSSA
jgi:hypothetical protein